MSGLRQRHGVLGIGALSLLIVIYFVGKRHLWPGIDDEALRIWVRHTEARRGSAIFDTVALSPAPLEAAWCATATDSTGVDRHSDSVPNADGAPRDFHVGVAGRAMRWRAAFDYCKAPPPCVFETTTDAASSTVSIRAVHRAERPVYGSLFAGEAFEIVIRTRDALGRERQCGGDSFQVELRGPSLLYGHAMDNLDGTYTYAAVLYDPGTYELRVRLDYRACVGLTQCDWTLTKTMDLEYIGKGSLQIDVVAAAAPVAGGRACVTTGGVRVPCGVVYMANRTFDDPAYRRGRWQSDAVACESADALVNSSAPVAVSDAREALSREGTRLHERCRDQSLRSHGLLWRPIDGDERPVFPTSSLRGKWLHSIGDSLSRNLNLAIGAILRRNFKSELFCLYALAAEMDMHPSRGVSFMCPEAAQVPFLVRDNNCNNLLSTLKPPPTWWTAAGTKRVFAAQYRLIWMHEYFPSLDFRLTLQWMMPGRRSIFNGQTPFVTFRSWAFEPYVRLVDSHKGPWASPPAAAPSPADNATAVESNAARSNASTDAQPPPFARSMTVVDRAMLGMLFPNGTSPSYVLVNAGLHHLASTIHIDGWYEDYVEQLLERLRTDFPPPATRLIWRSTAQTQWWDRELPNAHMCRTTYRLAFLNERAANAIARFNQAESAAGRRPISVLDYLQISLGRPDAAPDNRHYNMSVEGTVVDELFNMLGDCS